MDGEELTPLHPNYVKVVRLNTMGLDTAFSIVQSRPQAATELANA